MARRMTCWGIVGLLFFATGCWDEEENNADFPSVDAGNDQQTAETGADGALPDTIEPDVVVDGSAILRGSVSLYGKQDHSGIVVQIEGTTLSATTAEDGSFVMENIPAGSVDLSFSFSPYQPERLTGVGLVDDETTGLDPIVLRLGKRLKEGEGYLPLAFAHEGNQALYFSDFEALIGMPSLGTGTLWSHDFQSSEDVNLGSDVLSLGIALSPDTKVVAVLKEFNMATQRGKLIAFDFENGEEILISSRPKKALSQRSSQGLGGRIP